MKLESALGSARRTSENALKVCVVTAARSEYGVMRWVLEELRSRAGTRLQLVVTGAHLSERYGQTWREIEADGFHIDARIPIDVEGEGSAALAAGAGALTIGFAAVLQELKPDLVLVMGDRYELLGVIAACVIMTVPIAHVSGGETTEGAIDEQVRHAVTKASHLHCASNQQHARRIRQMGEEGWRICDSGEPGLDAIGRAPLLDHAALCADVGLPVDGPLAVVTYHPVTLQPQRQEAELAALDTALRWMAKERGARLLLTYPNADAGNAAITKAWERLVQETPGAVLVKSLGHLRYLSALQSADLMIGNSSSGLIEAPAFKLPVVNIGDRQGGRMRGANVMDTPGDPASVIAAVEAALRFDRSPPLNNPYGGDGRSSARIVDFIEQAFADRSREALLHKRFVNLTLDDEEPTHGST